MIVEINLLPKKIREENRLRIINFYMGTVIVVIIVIASFFIFKQQQKNAALDAEIKAIDVEAAGLKDKIEQVRKFNVMEQMYNDKKTLVDSLLKEQSLWTELLDKIADITPADMWMTIFTENRQREDALELSLGGNATSKMIVADFIKRLEQTEGIADIRTVFLRDAEVGTYKSIVFSVDFNYKTK